MNRTIQDQIEHLLTEFKSNFSEISYITFIQDDGASLIKIGQLDLINEAFIFEFIQFNIKICASLNQGNASEAFIKSNDQFVMLSHLKDKNLVLGIAGSSSINFGLLNSSCKSLTQKINDILKD